jgi:Gram-negative bacterial TonB protein C-terminal
MHPLSTLISAQQTASQQTASPADVITKPIPAYSDGSPGLEHFMKDYIKLVRSKDKVRAEEYLNSLAMPDPDVWYTSLFGTFLGPIYKTSYLAHRDSDLRVLGLQIEDALNHGFKDVQVIKYEKSCPTFVIATRYPVLRAEITSVPLYEVNLLQTSVHRADFWAFAYSGGGFRFVGAVAAPQHFPPSFDESNSPIPRIKVDEKAQAANVTTQEKPPFPAVAKNSGIIREQAKLRLLIGTDGAVKDVIVIEGDCYFSDLAVSAAKKCRYAPTVVNGKAVEVETEAKIEAANGR